MVRWGLDAESSALCAKWGIIRGSSVYLYCWAARRFLENSQSYLQMSYRDQACDNHRSCAIFLNVDFVFGVEYNVNYLHSELV